MHLTNLHAEKKNFHGQFDRQGRKYIARSLEILNSFIETKSIHVTSNSDNSMFAVNKCPSYGKDHMLGMVLFINGVNNCPVVKQKTTLFGDVGVASCIASPCLDPNNILYRTFSFD